MWLKNYFRKKEEEKLIINLLKVAIFYKPEQKAKPEIRINEKGFREQKIISKWNSKLFGLQTEECWEEMEEEEEKEEQEEKEMKERY